MNLPFLNANWYRQYPFTSTASMIDPSYNIKLENDIISACRLTIDPANLDIYISKIYINNRFISVEFSSGNGVVGVAKGIVSISNQTLVVTPLIATLSGFIVVGNVDKLDTSAIYNFDSDSGRLEPSVVTVFSPPLIKGIQHGGSKLTGSVSITSTNLIITVNSSVVNIAVLAPQDVVSRMDKTSALLTCSNPIISGINSITPDSNNIDIYGISPVTINVINGVLVVGTDGIAVADVCQPGNIPPSNTSNAYYNDITTVDKPEWSTWPQYS